ncbi:hypothetical protein K788_00002650 [Paraburkholderia caribensis MBA4]|uniref:Uncharacterized protein n=1 Tax=Paraburkholderia caribensis MBA4 TaxID=1323664 RepID=A0A0P0RI64_9BURK|nr:hypothetical protein K788_00002650 [Paraburkholderia caribensis MBA4]
MRAGMLDRSMVTIELSSNISLGVAVRTVGSDGDITPALRGGSAGKVSRKILVLL